MNDLRRIYRLIGLFGLIGFGSDFTVTGIRDALAFALGAAGSFGNFWLFDRISRRIAPGASAKRPWEAGAFITRYLVLLGIGYAIVKALNVSPLPVIWGLFVSTVAVLASLAIELFAHFTRKRISS
jgi:hypothetical protein